MRVMAVSHISHSKTRQVAETTKRWWPVPTRRCFRRRNALVNVLVDEVLMLHCHENGDCQEPDDRHPERSRVWSELHCCQDEDEDEVQVIGCCDDQDDVCQSA